MCGGAGAGSTTGIAGPSRCRTCSPARPPAPTEALGREVSIVVISETVLVLAGGTAVLSILFGMRVAMRAVAGGAAAPRSDGGQAAGGSGTPDVAGVIALPPLIVLGFLAAAAVLEAIVPLPVPGTQSL